MPETHASHSVPGIALKERLRAATIHLLSSAGVAALAAALVFLLWYPSPFREISGGRELFLLVTAVDVVLGPLLTLAIFNVAKPRLELMRDLGVVVALQVAALAYGLYTVAQARPAIVALEGDRLRVVRAIDLADTDLTKAPEGLQALSWLGPLTVATRPPTEREKFDTIQRGLAGEDIGMRPEFWLPPKEASTALARAAKPLDRIERLWPQHSPALQGAVAASGRSRVQLGYLPILARRTDWSALIDLRDGTIAGYVPIDGF